MTLRFRDLPVGWPAGHRSKHAASYFRQPCPVHRGLFAMSGFSAIYDKSMPYGLRRFQKAEALHFVTFSCFHRLSLLEAPGPKDTVEVALEQIRARHDARIYAYVLMPQHVHLLINEPPSILLAQFLKSLKQITYAD